jgi:hypothetical protein
MPKWSIFMSFGPNPGGPPKNVSKVEKMALFYDWQKWPFFQYCRFCPFFKNDVFGQNVNFRDFVFWPVHI